MGVQERQQEDVPSKALQKILRAAELEFAEKGFDGAGMKALAQRAGVSQSLLHYHFGSKDQLYSDVIRTRSTQINTGRRARLEGIDLSQSDALVQVVEALFLPALGPEGGGRAYARIFAGLIAGNARDQALVREYYDPTAEIFLTAIQTALGGADRTIAAQVYQFALGVLASVISKDGRVQRLMGEGSVALDEDALTRQLVRFVVGGARAIADDTSIKTGRKT
jgi:AcrR family transcriptional regulator